MCLNHSIAGLEALTSSHSTSLFVFSQMRIIRLISVVGVVMDGLRTCLAG